MLEAGVQVGLLAQGTDAAEVRVVDVRVHPEEAFEDGLHHRREIGREGLPVPLREQPLVVYLQNETRFRVFRSSPKP